MYIMYIYNVYNILYYIQTKYIHYILTTLD